MVAKYWRLEKRNENAGVLSGGQGRPPLLDAQQFNKNAVALPLFTALSAKSYPAHRHLTSAFLLEKTTDDCFFRFFIAEAEGHQLEHLLTSNLANCCFVHQLRLGTFSPDFRNRADNCFIHDN